MIRALSTAALFAVLASPAFAQNAGSWSGVVGVGTDNRSKEASKSDGEPYVWGNVEWESASGLFYAGPGFETIKSSTGSDLEAEFNVGVRPELAGFDLDISATRKWQIDANPGTDHEAWEYTADVKRSIGPASGRVRLQHSPDGTGSTEAWTWIAARVSWDFGDKLSGSVEIGRREQDNAIDYTGWNAGFSYALTRSLEAELRYHATDADVPGQQYADALVAGVSIAF